MKRNAWKKFPWEADDSQGYAYPKTDKYQVRHQQRVCLASRLMFMVHLTGSVHTVQRADGLYTST